MEIKPLSEIPKTRNVYNELKDVNYIGVSNKGEIINLLTEERIKTYEHENYYSVVIKNNRYYLHKLVALLFVEGFENNKVVFHINKNTLDNRSSNLSWQTQSFVSRTRKDFKFDNRGRKIALIDNKGNILKIYNTGGEAARELNLNRSEVYRVCKGKRNHVGGYKFKYVEEE